MDASPVRLFSELSTGTYEGGSTRDASRVLSHAIITDDNRRNQRLGTVTSASPIQCTRYDASGTANGGGVMFECHVTETKECKRLRTGRPAAGRAAERLRRPSAARGSCGARARTPTPPARGPCQSISLRRAELGQLFAGTGEKRPAHVHACSGSGSRPSRNLPLIYTTT